MRFPGRPLPFLVALVAMPLAALPRQAAETVRLTHRHSTVLTEEKDVQKIAIGDPEILDAVVVKKREILLNAKSPGRTNLILWYADDSRKDRLVQVEHDVALLREQLGAIDRAITVETSPDGKAIILRGTVAHENAVQLALEAAARFVETAPAAAPRPAPAEPPAKPEAVQPSAPVEARGRLHVLNMLALQAGPQSLEQKVQEAVRQFSSDIRVARVRQAATPDDRLDSFMIEGTVPSQTVMTQMFIVVDRMLGGPGTDFKVVANEGGGLHGVQAPQAPPAPSLLQPDQKLVFSTPSATPAISTLAPNNLNSNIARGAAVMGKTGRWVSFVRVRSLPQVLVSVRVLDLDRNRLRQVGFNWSSLWSTGGTIPGPARSDVMSITNGLLSNSFTIIDRKFLLTQVLTALEVKGYARTLSEPNLVALSGEYATFVVGGDVPIQTLAATTGSTFSGFVFREFGIRLTMRPLVGEDGRTITIDLNPEISEVEQPPPGAVAPPAPTFRRTSLLSTAQLKEGEGLILGGLISKSENPVSEQVPFLGDLPILGALFKRQTDREGQRELALVLLPKIIYPKPANAFALEVPPRHFEIRGGAFTDPDLGSLPAVPGFFYKNVAEGERR